MAAEERLVSVLERLEARMDANGDKTIQDILDLMQYNASKDYEIEFFTYPYDGTRASLAAGTTTIDFQHGTIKDPDGLITKLSTSLGKKKKDFLRSVAINGDKNIVIQLDENNKIPVRGDNWFVGTYQQFTKLHITVTATTTVFLLACTNPKAVLEMVAETTVTVGKETRSYIDSDKDSHFTTSIAQNAIETENLTGLSDSNITITGVSVQADEALDFRLWLFGTDGHADTDLDDDEFIDFVDLDLATNGAQIAGAGQYYYAQTGLNIDYEDEDASNELHLALQNLSAAAKTAGAAGEVKVKIFYTPRM